ncbi:MAG: helix-turn-helix transcriptional regulator [Gammaproteobacteria bacterium]
MANILILAFDRQLTNQWISQLAAEHDAFIADDPLSADNFAQDRSAEMAIVDAEVLSADPAAAAPLISKGIKILIIGKNWPDDRQIDALIAGCYGYCETAAASELLPKAVNSVLKGDVWIPRHLVPKVIGMLVKLSPAADDADKERNGLIKNLDLLTYREKDVAKMLGAGLSNKSIASMLNISERTVKAHLTSIFQKLEVQDRLQLALMMKDIN